MQVKVDSVVDCWASTWYDLARIWSMEPNRAAIFSKLAHKEEKADKMVRKYSRGQKGTKCSSPSQVSWFKFVNRLARMRE